MTESSRTTEGPGREARKPEAPNPPWRSAEAVFSNTTAQWVFASEKPLESSRSAGLPMHELARKVGNTTMARLARQGDGGAPPGGAPEPAQDPGAPAEALTLNGYPMDSLLTALAAKDRQWLSVNREALTGTPGVDPRRMALALEAVLAGPQASDERLTVMMGEMQAMGLPEDQQEAIARYCGAFGLRAPTIMDAYVAGAKALQAQWPGLTPSARAQSLGNLAAASLSKAGVPTPLGVDVEEIEAGGEWDCEHWRIKVSPRIGSLRNDPLTYSRAASTIYHEARHGEQDFVILRMLAGLKLSDDEIQAKYKAPSPILQAARQAALPPSDELAGKALKWYAAQGLDLDYKDRPVERDAFGAGEPVMDRVFGTPADRRSELRKGE